MCPSELARAYTCLYLDCSLSILSYVEQIDTPARSAAILVRRSRVQTSCLHYMKPSFTSESDECTLQSLHSSLQPIQTTLHQQRQYQHHHHQGHHRRGARPCQLDLLPPRWWRLLTLSVGPAPYLSLKPCRSSPRLSVCCASRTAILTISCAAKCPPPPQSGLTLGRSWRSSQRSHDPTR